MPSSMVARGQVLDRAPIDPFSDPKHRWCFRDGAAGGKEWQRKVREYADELGLTSVLEQGPPTLEEVIKKNPSLEQDQAEAKCEPSSRSRSWSKWQIVRAPWGHW